MEMMQGLERLSHQLHKTEGNPDSQRKDDSCRG